MKKLTCLLLSLLAVLTVLVGCSNPSTSDPGNNTYPTGDPMLRAFIMMRTATWSCLGMTVLP